MPPSSAGAGHSNNYSFIGLETNNQRWKLYKHVHKKILATLIDIRNDNFTLFHLNNGPGR